MGSTQRELRTLHSDICRSLEIGEESKQMSWDVYASTKTNYSLEGCQSHWLAVSIYAVSCKTPPLLPAHNNLNEKNLNLTKLLRLTNLGVLDFIKKSKKWAEMLTMTYCYRNKIDDLEGRFAVSSIIFKKYQDLFVAMFHEPYRSFTVGGSVIKKSENFDLDHLFEFCWVLYISVRSEYSCYVRDFVNSYHLLLACCDCIYSNVIVADRPDLLNKSFAGFSKSSLKKDYSPPEVPTSVMDPLCLIHDGLSKEAKHCKIYKWNPVVQDFLHRDLLQSKRQDIFGLLASDVFEKNYESLNKYYEDHGTFILNYDERQLLFDVEGSSYPPVSKVNVGSYKPASENSGSSESRMKNYGPTKADIETALRRVPMGQMFDGVPVKKAAQNISKLYGMLAYRRPSLDNELLNVVKQIDESLVVEIDQRLKTMVQMVTSYFLESGDQICCNSKRLMLTEVLYYKLMGDIIWEEIRLPQEFLKKLLREETFHRTLFACCLEIVVFSHTLQPSFLLVFNVLEIHAFHFFKIIEIIVRTETQFSREIVQHLHSIEDRVLDSMAWQGESPLWNMLHENNQPIPTSEEVFKILESYERNEQSQNPTPKCLDGKIEEKPVLKRKGCIELFFRKFYNLASERMKNICENIKINNEEDRRKMWTCFEHVIVTSIEMMKNRHLDQMIMCSIYVVCKVLNVEMTFQEIMRVYRYQPQSASHIYRSVLISNDATSAPLSSEDDNQEERGDLVQFYNRVFIRHVQELVLQFPRKSSLNLSPLPSVYNKLSPFTSRVSEQFPITVRSLDAPVTIPKDTPCVSYIIKRSPGQDLYKLNEAIHKRMKLDAPTNVAADGSFRFRDNNYRSRNGEANNSDDEDSDLETDESDGDEDIDSDDISSNDDRERNNNRLILEQDSIVENNDRLVNLEYDEDLEDDDDEENDDEQEEGSDEENGIDTERMSNRMCSENQISGSSESPASTSTFSQRLNGLIEDRCEKASLK